MSVRDTSGICSVSVRARFENFLDPSDSDGDDCSSSDAGTELHVNTLEVLASTSMTRCSSSGSGSCSEDTSDENCDDDDDAVSEAASLTPEEIMDRIVRSHDAPSAVEIPRAAPPQPVPLHSRHGSGNSLDAFLREILTNTEATDRRATKGGSAAPRRPARAVVASPMPGLGKAQRPAAAPSRGAYQSRASPRQVRNRPPKPAVVPPQKRAGEATLPFDDTRRPTKRSGSATAVASGSTARQGAVTPRPVAGPAPARRPQPVMTKVPHASAVAAEWAAVERIEAFLSSLGFSSQEG